MGNMLILRKSILAFGLILIWSLACSEKTVHEPDINETLQGNGRWECETRTDDAEGNRIEFSAVLLFTAPSNYRLFYFTMKENVEIPGTRHDEHGTYEVVVFEQPNAGAVTSGTLTFTSEEVEPWSSEFNILQNTGDLVITTPGAGELTFTFFRYGWG